MSDSDLVSLPNGLTVPVAVVRVLLDLEERGVRLRLDGEDSIIASPRAILTDADRAVVQRWRPHILAVLHYCLRETVQ